MMLNKLSLNTIGLNRIGLNRIGKPSRGSSDRPYIDPEVLASLKAVCICYGKSNDDPDRAIVKNLVDPDNPFIISNAAYKLNSGYGKYEEDFTSWIQTNGVIVSSDRVQNSILGRFLYFNTVDKKEDVPTFKVNIKLGEQSKLQYNYIKEDGTSTYVIYSESGIYTIPASYFSKYTGGNAWFGFYQIEGTSTIEQIPSYQGAFVTDGIDDLITSTKTVQEMLEGSNEITAISMIGYIDSTYDARINFAGRTFGNTYLNNRIKQASGKGKSYILGYTKSSNGSITNIDPLLGDKADCSSAIGDDSTINATFSVAGYIKENNTAEYNSVAWYWTVVANKILTTDQINQVIAYFNLDRCVEPTVWYDVQKQGLTNDTPAADWYLKDFSKNGFDMSLFNFAKDGDSGIGKYNYPNWKVTATVAKTYSTIVNYPTVNGTYSINVSGVSEMMQSIGMHLEVKYTTPTGIIYNDIKQDGVYSYILPDGATDLTLRFGGIPGIVNEPCNITITQIPSHAGALCFDGVDDYGKVTGLPIYKDYTAIVCREFISDKTAPILSKAKEPNNGAFVVEIIANPDFGSTALYSFGKDTPNIDIIQSKSISYQTKYIYNSKDIVPGDGVDSDTMWIGKLRDNHTWFANAAIYSLMTFPYSMSEFLIERQLKKRKAGTLYPDMVEFRPVIKANANYKISYYQIDSTNTWKSIKAGEYIIIGTKLAFQITFDNEVSELAEVVSSELTNITIEKRPSNPGYNIYSYIGSKSPQKIDITIDEYIRYEDIVQPYPSLFTLIDYDTKETYSWGSKLKVGAKFTGKVINLLPDMYQWDGDVLYNGKTLNWGINPGIVAKEMIFSWSKPFKYLFDNNAPKCILSPNRLRIPNSSYKILGYIPDLSGNGNHGKINNSAYAGMSGANGYLQNFSDWTKATGASSTDSIIASSRNLDATKGWVAYVRSGTVIPTFKVQISGIPTNGNLRFEGSDQSLANGVNTIQGLTAPRVTGFYISSGYDNDWSNLKIEQIGEYEGAYCLDGVDDFITIPTLSSGGKQVLMKVNWQNDYDIPGYMYDTNIVEYRNYIIKGNKEQIAYENASKTYIDGILNANLTSGDLKGITHNITSQFNGISSTTYIGCRYSLENFLKMSLYDFMLFDEISTDEEIATLNEYIGIEPKVTVPPYYWDAYGRSNMEAAYDRALMLNLGKIPSNDTSNALTANNMAWDLMSGYGGWEFPKFTDDVAWHISPNTSIEVVNRTNYSVTLRKLANTYYFYFQKAVSLIYRQVPFKVRTDKAIKVCWDLHYTPTGGTEQSLRLVEQLVQPNVDTMVTLTYKTEEELNDLNADLSTVFYIVYFDLYTMTENEEVTVTELPLYPNGLCLDGVDDYLLNRNIPVFTDFTVISKRIWLEENTSNKPFIIKGDTLYPDGVKNAFLFEYGKLSTYCFGQNNKYDESVVPSLISYATKQSYNGVVSLVKGSATDTIGLDIAHNTRMVFYKLMLYPKTLTNLEIMFLKNMFEKDEIIDLTNPIFIKE